MKIAKKMNLSLFVKWMQENLKCELRQSGRRIDAVINADVLEKGTFAALFAQMEGSQLIISELVDTFYSLEASWAALDSDQADAYDPVPFHQWVKDQYWTAKEVKVERIEF